MPDAAGNRATGKVSKSREGRQPIVIPKGNVQGFASQRGRCLLSQDSRKPGQRRRQQRTGLDVTQVIGSTGVEPDPQPMAVHVQLELDTAAIAPFGAGSHRDGPIPGNLPQAQ